MPSGLQSSKRKSAAEWRGFMPGSADACRCLSLRVCLNVGTFKELMMRNILISVWLDFTNNYLTISKYAEHNGLTEYEADQLLKLAAIVSSHNHPEE